MSSWLLTIIFIISQSSKHLQRLNSQVFIRSTISQTPTSSKVPSPKEPHTKTKMSATRGSPLLSFLPLGPVTSASFPKAQEARPAVEAAQHKRRSSSLSSDGKSAGFRVLKVAPVHYGEHSGEHQDDWHEVVSVVE